MPRNKGYSEEEVLEKAMQLFWNNGYEATSVRLLEKEMGINQFSIYSTFNNKKKLFIESLVKYREYVKINRFASLLAVDAGMAELRLFFQGFSKRIRTGGNVRGCLVVNTTGELGIKDKDVTVELKNYFDFIKSTLEHVLENAIRKGEISADADIEKYANFLLGVMQGLSVGAKILSENQVEDIVSTALSGIK